MSVLWGTVATSQSQYINLCELTARILRGVERALTGCVLPCVAPLCPAGALGPVKVVRSRRVTSFEVVSAFLRVSDCVQVAVEGTRGCCNSGGERG
eukprot:230692-Pleurochrysis_carterae.AAC.2